MFASGWNSNSGKLSCSYSGSMGGFASHFLKKEEVALLINGVSRSEENIDKAYGIAKTIEIHYDRIYAINDVAIAYTKLKTTEAFRKAYQATLSVSDQIDVKDFLRQISEKCRELNNDEAMNLAQEIEQFTQNYSF